MNTKEQVKNNGGWIGLLFLIHFVVLAIARDSEFYFNIILSAYCVLLAICVIYNIVTDFLEIKNNAKLLNLKKEKKHLFLPYLLLLIVKNIGRYLFLGMTAFLFYCFSTKDLSLIRSESLYIIVLLVILFILLALFSFIFNPKTRNNKFTSYYFMICFVNTFAMLCLSASPSIDDLVRQKQEQLISHYMQLCTKQQCNETFYFSQKDNNNMFSQKYRVRVFHNIDNEKCVSIMNTYFDSHLNIGKCENEKDKTDENAVKIQDK